MHNFLRKPPTWAVWVKTGIYIHKCLASLVAWFWATNVHWDKHIFSKLGLVGAWSTFLKSWCWPSFQLKHDFNTSFNFTWFNTCRDEPRPAVHQPSLLNTIMVPLHSYLLTELWPMRATVVHWHRKCASPHASPAWEGCDLMQATTSAVGMWQGQRQPIWRRGLQWLWTEHIKRLTKAESERRRKQWQRCSILAFCYYCKVHMFCVSGINHYDHNACICLLLDP